MPRLKTDQLKEGMVVAEGVKNIDNMLLIPAGCALSERHINILQSWGINEIDVQADANTADTGDPLAKLPPEILARLTAEVRGYFWQLDETNPVTAEIFKLILQLNARRRTKSAP